MVKFKYYQSYFKLVRTKSKNQKAKARRKAFNQIMAFTCLLVALIVLTGLSGKIYPLQ